MKESQNKKNLTRNGFIMNDQKYDKELERFLATVPYIQRQGIKGMLHFFNIKSLDEVSKFIRSNFATKPTKNIVVNAIIKKLDSEAYAKNLSELKGIKRDQSRVQDMCRFSYFMETGIRVNEDFFYKLGIESEEELALRISLELYNCDTIPVPSNYINISFSHLAKVSRDDFYQYEQNYISDRGIIFSDVDLESRIEELLGSNNSKEQFVKACLLTYGCRSKWDYFSLDNDYRWIRNMKTSNRCLAYVASNKFKEIKARDFNSNKRIFFNIIDDYIK